MATDTLAAVRPTKAAFAALVLLAVASASCRSAVSRPAPLADDAVRLDLPLVRQDALYECGLASLSALCRYWGVEVPADERAALARTAANDAGLSGDELRGALERLGFEVFLFQGSLDRTTTGLYPHIDAGRPPLVMLSSDGHARHYELVLGYEASSERLILLDPMHGEVLVPVSLFERDWARCQRFTLLACRPGASDHEREGATNTVSSSKEMNP